MINHYIILADGWSVSSRIALHYTFDGPPDGRAFRQDVKRIQNCFERDYAKVAVHTIQSLSESWESVVAKDSYFDDVRVIDTVEEFIDILRKDECPRSDVVSQYILNLTECGMDRLNMLLYLCDAEYIMRCGYQLFQDRMDVVDGMPRFGMLEDALRRGYLRMDDGNVLPKAPRLPAQARIMSSSDGLRRASTVRRAVEVYGTMTDAELRDIILSEDIGSMTSDGFPVPELVAERHQPVI